MNKVINFSILYVFLMLLETVISILFFLVYNLFQGYSYFYNSINVPIGWSFWRVLFYGLPFLLLYFLLFRHFENIKLYKPLTFSLFNVLIYVLLSVLSRLIWGKNVPLPPEGIMFWVTCIAIFISPLILGQIPYFKKLMENL